MPRLNLATDRESVPEAARRAYDEAIQSRGRVAGPTAVAMIYTPEAATRMILLGNSVRFESSLSRAETELATIVAARAVDAAYVWSAHVPAALEQGVSQEAVEAVNSGGPLSGLSADEALIIQFGRELVTDRRLTPATFEKTKARYGEKGIVELASLVGFYLMVSCVITAAELEPRPVTPALATK